MSQQGARQSLPQQRSPLQASLEGAVVMLGGSSEQEIVHTCETAL